VNDATEETTEVMSKRSAIWLCSPTFRRPEGVSEGEKQKKKTFAPGGSLHLVYESNVDYAAYVEGTRDWQMAGPIASVAGVNALRRRGKGRRGLWGLEHPSVLNCRRWGKGRIFV